MKSTTLENIGFGSTGNVIFGEKASSLSFADSTFDNNYNSYIVSEGSPTAIKNSNFTNGSGESFVTIKETTVTVSDRSNFANNKNPSGTGLAINCVSCT